MALRLNGSSSGYVELDVPAAAGSHTLTLPDGGGSSGNFLRTDGSGGLSWATPAAGLFESYAILEDQKSANTHGGTFNTGSFLTRDLNTEVADPDGIVSLSSNQFTLAAGNYFVVWSAPAYDAGRHKAQLFNATDSTVVANGSSEISANNGSEQSRSVGSARVVITESKAFEIRHRALNGNTTTGFGLASDFGVVEVYTRVEIYKEA